MTGTAKSSSSSVIGMPVREFRASKSDAAGTASESESGSPASSLTGWSEANSKSL